MLKIKRWKFKIIQTGKFLLIFTVIIFWLFSGWSQILNLLPKVELALAAPTFSQSAYRFFENANSAGVTTALANQDTVATLASTGDAFRLRELLHVDTENLSINSQNFKLQFAQQSGTCDTSFTGESYADVTASTGIAYNNNATPADEAALTASNVAWYNSSWLNRRKITFDNSASAENLANFPVAVFLSSSNIDYSKTKDAGEDIRFTDSNGTTLLYYEIEKWNESGTSVVWVSVPQINSGSTTDFIYVYYNNTSATDAQSPVDVWDDNFKGVWHLGETSGTRNDSTQYNNDMSDNNTVTSATGKMGTAAHFNDAASEYLSIASAVVSIVPSTLSAWHKKDDTNAGSALMSIHDSTSGLSYIDLEDWSDEITYVTTKSNSGTYAEIGTTTTSTLNQWNYATGISYSTSSRAVFVNAGNEGTNTTSITPTSVDTTFIGAHEGPSIFFSGDIDEVRISDIVRSADWIEAEYISGNDNFNTFGSEETYSAYDTDPSHSTDVVVNQSYQELNNFANTEGAINSGQDGMWDFALKDLSASANTAYCFRVVKSDGTQLDIYPVVPQITTASSAQTLTFSISDNSIGFGTLSSSAARYATGTSGTDTADTEAHTLTVATNATNGYNMTVNGTTLTCSACGGATISAIGASSATTSPGTEQFGLRMTATGGSGAVSSPYGTASQYALDTAAFPDQVASSSGTSTDTVYSVRYIGNITPTTEAGSYNTVLTYVVTASF